MQIKMCATFLSALFILSSLKGAQKGQTTDLVCRQSSANTTNTQVCSKISSNFFKIPPLQTLVLQAIYKNIVPKKEQEPFAQQKLIVSCQSFRLQNNYLFSAQSDIDPSDACYIPKTENVLMYVENSLYPLWNLNNVPAEIAFLEKQFDDYTKKIFPGCEKGLPNLVIPFIATALAFKYCAISSICPAVFTPFIALIINAATPTKTRQIHIGSNKKEQKVIVVSNNNNEIYTLTNQADILVALQKNAIPPMSEFETADDYRKRIIFAEKQLNQPL